MSGYIRQIQSSDGTPITAPSTVILGAASYVVFANDAAYEAVYGAGSEGDAYFNSTDQQVRIYKNAAWEYHKADESVYDNATSGLTATDVQAAIDEVEGRVDTLETSKQDDVITTRGDTIIGNASGDASRLAIGSAGFVLTSDGTDPAWAPAAGGGGVGGKNYILNPDAAVNATTGVTNTATTGSWTIARTTTAAELPEETKGTAYKISGSTLTVGDTVEYAIEATGIDDADGGFIARGVIKVLDISGTINGEYKGQFYSVTDSVYVGDEVTITGTGTYTMSVPVIAGNDYEFHLKAATASPTNIGLSGITLEPVSQTVAGVVSKWQTYTPSVVGAASVTGDFRYRTNGQNVEGMFDFELVTTNGSTASLSLPNNWAIDLDSADEYVIGHYIRDGVTTNVYQQPILGISGDTVIKFGRNVDGLVENSAAPISGTTLGTQRVTCIFSVPVVELANNFTPTISDVQYENARIRRISNNEATSNGATIQFATADYLKGGGSFASGQYTVPVAGEYSVDLSIRTSESGLQFWSLEKNGTQVAILAAAASGNYAQGSMTVSCEAGDTLSVQNDSGATRTTLASTTNSTMAITKVSDFSARSVSLPLSTRADETEQYLLPDIRTSGEGDLGTITNWATVDSKKYRWYVIGKMCFYEHRCESTSASTSTTLVSVDLPSDVPTPKAFSNATTNEWQVTATGARSTSTGGTLVDSGNGVYNSAGTLRVYSYTPSNHATQLWIFSAFWQID